MAFRGEFRNTSTGNNKEVFETTFEKLHQKFLNEEGFPSPEEDANLLELFQKAYPDTSDYINTLFIAVTQLSEKHQLPLPKCPDPNILDLNETPLAGMGKSFFERLVYLNKIAVQTSNKIDAELELQKPRTLPQLQLVMGVDIFDAIRIGSMNQIAKGQAGLTSNFRHAKNDEIQVGQVQSCKVISEVENGKFIHRKLAHVKMDAGKMIEVFIEGKAPIQTGDLIGVTHRKRSEAITSLLVPHTVYQFLESIEPNFRSQRSKKKQGEEYLSDEHQGTLILGTIIRGQATDRKIAILDKNNEMHEVRLDELLKDFDLKEGDMLIAHPNKLDSDGTYKIAPKNTLKLDATWAERLISGLPAVSTQQPVIKVTEANFAPTEQMPH